MFNKKLDKNKKLLLQVATGYLYSLVKLLFRCKMCRKMETLILHRFISLVKTWNNYCLIFPVLRKTECIEKKKGCISIMNNGFLEYNCEIYSDTFVRINWFFLFSFLFSR